MKREEFLKIKNRYNVPGYTDEEIDRYLGKDTLIVRKCPICGNSYGDGLEMCKMCGYDPEIYMNNKAMEYLEEKYKAHKLENPDYIWAVKE